MLAFTACDTAQPDLTGHASRIGEHTLPTATRLASATVYPACRRPGADPAAACTADPPPVAAELRALLADVRRSAARGDSVDAPHAEALIDLIWADTEVAIDRAIASLQPLLATQDSASVLADLTVAWERKARLSQRTAHWVRALDHAERAHSAARTPVTRLNRAVLLDRFRMTATATDAWDSLAASPARHPWMAEADARSAALRSARFASAVEADLNLALAHDEASLDSVRQTAREFPQVARRFATLRILPRWATAWQSGDSVTATRAIDLLDHVGRGIADRSGDTGFADEAARLRSGSVPDRIADAYVAYADAETAFDEVRLDDMARLAALAVALAGSHETIIAPWATYLLGIYLSRTDPLAADSIFVSILRDPANRTRHSLRGRALWGRGLMAAFDFQGGTAVRFYMQADAELRRSFEGEYIGGILALIVEQVARSGDWLEAWDRLGEAIDALAGWRGSVHLANAFRRAADMAARDGHLHAALAFQREGLNVAHATPRIQQPIEAGINLGLLLARLGRGLEAEAVWVRAQRDLPRVPAQAMRDRLTADLRSARISAALLPSLRAASDVPVDSITKSLEYFERIDLGSRTALLRYDRAEVLLALGDTAAALADLETAVELIVHALRDLGAPRRLPLAPAERVIERLTQILAAADRPDRALAISDIARAVQLGRYDLARLDSPVLPADRSALTLMALPDELLIWRIDDGNVAFDRVPVARTTIADSIYAFTRHLLDGLAPETSSAGLWLGGLLFPDPASIPPVLPVIAGATFARLALAAIPLDADGTLVVDRTAILAVPSVRHFAAALEPPHSDAGRVILAAGSGDPDARLAALPYARYEVDAIAALHRSATILGPAANRDSLLAALGNARIFHFAGHAQLGASPLDSRLVLRADADPASRYLYAADLVPGAFPNLESVILSSCHSLGTEDAGTASLPAFAAAFIAAGASNVTGTLWPVDDEAAARLMVAFHRQLEAGIPVHEALARTQRDARNANRSNTYARANLWAAFQVITSR